ncbi:hypothetical protein EVAR_17356_1 [Eumeta japonica]|uniref:Uncharacterized protein n=1 Tax=Eumeta variegata TaxID=151549 RepID=A0A4C1WJ10_EUMVA|nr:hypothetical protein EVAR_17356_1 [Eumeta japonica]
MWQKKNGSGINAVEKRSVRSMCGVSRKDRCRNSDVRERCGLKEGEVTRVESGMLRWFGLLERMNESRQTKQMYRANVCDGKKSYSLLRGQQRTGDSSEVPSVRVRRLGYRLIGVVGFIALLRKRMSCISSLEKSTYQSESGPERGKDRYFVAARWILGPADFC